MTAFPVEVDAQPTEPMISQADFTARLGYTRKTIKNRAAAGDVWMQPLISGVPLGYHLQQIDLYQLSLANPDESDTWLQCLEALRKNCGGARARAMRLLKARGRARAAS